MRFEREVEVNGIKTVAAIFISIENDQVDNSDFDSGCPEHDVRVRDRFNSGELQKLLVVVTANAHGLEGSDILGGVWVSSREINDDLMATVEDHGMIEDALEQLSQEIIETARALQQYVK